MASDPRLIRAAPRIATPPLPPPPPPLEAMPPESASVGYDGAENGLGIESARQDEGAFKLKFCTVCASNQNRYVCCVEWSIGCRE